jgi:hypothetical protein
VNQKPGMEPMTLSRMLGRKNVRILRLVQTSNSVAVYSGHGLQSCWVLGPARSGVEITRTRRIRQILEVLQGAKKRICPKRELVEASHGSTPVFRICPIGDETRFRIRFGLSELRFG